MVSTLEVKIANYNLQIFFYKIYFQAIWLILITKKRIFT